MSPTPDRRPDGGVTGREGPGPVMALRDLAVWFPPPRGRRRAGPVRAVDGVSLEVGPGEVLGLVGESGSGKTTLARAVLRLVEPTRGTVELEGRDVTHLSERRMRPLRRRIQPVFQDPTAALNPRMTVGASLAHPLRVHGLTRGREETRQRVLEMLERVGLSPATSYLDRRPRELSGGERQRAVIARALLVGPRLLVADEPVAMLDASVRSRILELLSRLRDELSLSYLLVTHDLATARLVCDRLAVMYLGRVVEQGPARELCRSPLHPYTQALLEAMPRPGRGPRSRPPQGEPPDASSPPAGCPFHPRCPDALAHCGWEGRDVLEWLERAALAPLALRPGPRTAPAAGGVPPGIPEALDLRPGRMEPLAGGGVRFPDGGPALARRLEELAAGSTPLARAVRHVRLEGGTAVEVSLLPGRVPRPTRVGETEVVCHLHGQDGRPDGEEEGPPPGLPSGSDRTATPPPPPPGEGPRGRTSG